MLVNTQFAVSAVLVSRITRLVIRIRSFVLITRGCTVLYYYTVLFHISYNWQKETMTLTQTITVKGGRDGIDMQDTEPGHNGIK